MARDDDNLNRPKGEEENDFAFTAGDDDGLHDHHDSDDFNVGDSPYENDMAFDDEEIVGQIDDMDEFGISADDDVLGETITQEDISPEDLAHFSESEEDAGHDDETPEHFDEDEYEEEPVANAGLGWKAWAGLAFAAVVVAGGAVYVTLPSSPQPARPAVQQVQNQQPAPPAAQQQSQQQASQTAPRNQVTESREQPRAQAINLDMNPGGAEQQESSAPTTQAMRNEPTPAPTARGNDGTEFRQSPIRDPREDIPVVDTTDAERQMAKSFTTKEDFSGLKSLVAEQGSQLGGLTEAFSRTEQTLRNIDSRLTAIEKRLDEDPEKVSKADPEKRLKPDDSVKEVQIILTAYNYRPGPIDGLMGRQTSAAIKRFQRTHNLTANGELNSETLTALRDDVKRYAGTSQRRASTKQTAPKKDQWFVRGVTTDRAIVYQPSGSSYMVSKGTEVPGMGQVVSFDPAANTVNTVNGTIRTQ